MRSADADRKTRHDAKRRAEKPWRKFYKDPRWYKLRRAQLFNEPYCRMCAEDGKRVPAAIVDHVTPHRGNEVAFFTGALQSLCKRCHDGRKQSFERSTSPGWNDDGTPADKGHAWYAERR